MTLPTRVFSSLPNRRASRKSKRWSGIAVLLFATQLFGRERPALASRSGFGHHVQVAGEIVRKLPEAVVEAQGIGRAAVAGLEAAEGGAGTEGRRITHTGLVRSRHVHGVQLHHATGEIAGQFR